MKDIMVTVIDNDVERALRILKKKIQNDGLFKRLKVIKTFEKPCQFRRRKMREAMRRQRMAVSKTTRKND
ncbi:MAG: 30S ribosomal protein S21 [Pseudomonadota bacterium]